MSPYSPDYNPIEEAFSKVKVLMLLRRASARTREDLIEALCAALEAVTARAVRRFFEHSGHRLPVQLS